MVSHLDRLEASVLLGVGAGFDINAGLVPRAPLWMQRSGLEWLFRLGTEPPAPLAPVSPEQPLVRNWHLVRPSQDAER